MHITLQISAAADGISSLITSGAAQKKVLRCRLSLSFTPVLASTDMALSKLPSLTVWPWSNNWRFSAKWDWIQNEYNYMYASHFWWDFSTTNIQMKHIVLVNKLDTTQDLPKIIQSLIVVQRVRISIFISKHVCQTPIYAWRSIIITLDYNNNL